MAFPALPVQHHHGNDPGEGSSRVCGINAVTGKSRRTMAVSPRAATGARRAGAPARHHGCCSSSPGPSLIPQGETAVSPVFPTLEQLPVNDLFSPQSQVQEAAKGIWGAPARLRSADPTGEDLALCWMLNLVEIAGLTSRATHQQPVPPVPPCLAASLELMIKKNTAACVDE